LESRAEMENIGVYLIYFFTCIFYGLFWFVFGRNVAFGLVVGFIGKEFVHLLVEISACSEVHQVQMFFID